MARIDAPPGFTYNPKTRGLTEIATGRAISRRQAEKARIARETGTSGSFEAKARKEQLMGPAIRLPRRLRVHHTGSGVGAQRRELVGQTRYRARTFGRALEILASLPQGAQVYVKILARRRQRNYRGRRGSPLLWASLSRLFRVEYLVDELPDMGARRAEYEDIRAYDIIVRAINP